MKNIVIYGHGSSLNHGCEAIVNTTGKMLRNGFPDARICLSTLDYANDVKAFCDIDSYIANSNVPDNPFFNGLIYINSFLLKEHRFSDWYRYRAFRREIKRFVPGSLWISAGGDNYCTKNPLWLYKQNQLIDSHGFRRILWGASIEPETLGDKMLCDLNGYESIFARESITKECLEEKGYKGKLFFHPDPAFTLPVSLKKIPKQMHEGEWIGLNLSPVIQRCESQKNIAFLNYNRLVRHILDTTPFNIALIPHVVLPNNSDYVAMKPLLSEFEATGRVIAISDNLSASEYKGIISSCKMFIGSRTHATIAAYSTCVPTVVIGYSVKAKGIAKDIFGTFDGYVLPVQQLDSENALTLAFDAASERISEDKKRLDEVIPNMIKASADAQDDLISEYGI